ncbi:MAG TPA: SDR family oxidoreductase [Devosia sp.]|nr:SDR family oxidoreductase [Devosia sp.]
MDITYTGRSVLVVGGTSGIGAGIVSAFAAAGATVIATGGTEAEVRAAKGPATHHVLDVRNNDAVKAFVSALPTLDVVVNCAGIIRRAEEYDPETFDLLLDVNLSGTMRVCVAARPLLKQSGGAILNIGSIFSVLGAPHAPGYAASKGGVANLTRSLAGNFAADGIRVNALAPGWIDAGIAIPALSNPDTVARIKPRIPLVRYGTPEDVANAALFLCSPYAGYITGVVLPVDGGYLAG